MIKLKIAYFGSPSFSADLLEDIINDHSLPVEVALAVTQPDKPVGKKHIITPSPVKVTAEKYNIPCWDKKLSETDAGAKLFDLLKTVDLALVFAYGFKELIPLDLLEAPKMKFDIGEGKQSGFINVHPSLLPLYRGSSPIAYPILLGDKETGVSLFVMDEKMDHGPVVAQERVQQLNDVRPAMETLLTKTGAKMAKKLLADLASGTKPQLTTQDHAKATRAPYMVKDDGFVSFDFLRKALKNEPIALAELPHILRNYLEKYPPAMKSGKAGLMLYNFWRGMYPWPGVWTKVSINGQEKRLKLNGMKLTNDTLTLTKVQLEGKNEVDFPTFQKAYGLL